MNDWMKFWKLPLLIILTTVLITGCGLQSNENSPNDDSPAEPQTVKETLNFRITWKTYSGRGEAISRIVDSYNAINQTAYAITLTDGDEDLKTIEDCLAQGGIADIYVLPYRFTQYLGHENKLEDLTESFLKEEDLFYLKLWQLGTVKGSTFGVPWVGHSMGLIYNKNLLTAAGVDPEAINSLDALVAACEKIEDKTEAQGIGLVGADHNDISWMVNQFIYGFGGTLVDPTGTKVTINSPQSRDAILFYKDVLGRHAQGTWTSDTGLEVMNYFRDQQIAFEIQGLWGVTDIWKSGSKFETGVIPLTDIGLYPEVGPMMLSVQPRLSDEKKAAAIEFIKYLISETAQEMIMDGEYSPEHDAYYPFRLPVRKDMADSVVLKNYSEFSVFISGFSKPSIDVPVPLWQRIKDEYYAPGLHLVMTDQMPVDEFLKLIQDNGDKILNEDK